VSRSPQRRSCLRPLRRLRARRHQSLRHLRRLRAPRHPNLLRRRCHLQPRLDPRYRPCRSRRPRSWIASNRTRRSTRRSQGSRETGSSRSRGNVGAEFATQSWTENLRAPARDLPYVSTFRADASSLRIPIPSREKLIVVSLLPARGQERRRLPAISSVGPPVAAKMPPCGDGHWWRSSDSRSGSSTAAGQSRATVTEARGEPHPVGTAAAPPAAPGAARAARPVISAPLILAAPARRAPAVAPPAAAWVSGATPVRRRPCVGAGRTTRAWTGTPATRRQSI